MKINFIHSRVSKYLSWMIFSFISFTNINAQSGLTKVGTTAANFLDIEIGARAVAMGGAYVGVADDASSIYWNPAGISLLKTNAVQYQFGKRFADIDHHYAGLIVPFTSSDNLGLMVDYLDFGDMEVTTIENPEGTGEKFNASNLAIGLSYSKQLTDRVYVGVLGKFIYEEIWLESASGFAFDIGTIYNIEDLGLRLGMNIVNLGPEMGINDGPQLEFYHEKPDEYPGSPSPESQLSTKTFPLPLGFNLGISSLLIGRKATWLTSAEHQLLLAFSVNDMFDAPIRANTGFEYGWNELLFFRGGYRIAYDTQKFSAGFGIDFVRFTNTNIKLDYVWVDYGDLGSINVWSLEFRF